MRNHKEKKKGKKVKITRKKEKMKNNITERRE